MNAKQLPFHSAFSVPRSSFRLFVSRVQTAATAELPEFEALRRRLLILRLHVITALAFCALKHNVIARHVSPHHSNKIPNNSL
jgi:hypothetical protein